MGFARLCTGLNKRPGRAFAYWNAPHAVVLARRPPYPFAMTKLLEDALEAVRRLPPESQDAIAQAMLALAGKGTEPLPLTPEEQAAIARSKAAAGRGEFASEQQVRDVWDKHGL